VPRITAAEVDAIAREAARLDRVIGVRSIDPEAGEESAER
jgi:hypothetical protein